MIVIGTEGSDGFVLDEGIAAQDPGEGGPDVGGFEVCPVITPEPFVEDGVELRPAVPDDAPVARLPYVGSEACGIEVHYQRIQRVVLVGASGNNAFWIRSTSPAREFVLLGGRDGDTFLVGDGDVEFVHDSDGGSWSGGDVTGIQGPVHVEGDGRDFPEFDLSVPDPVVLPGEDASPSLEPDIPDFDVVENTMVVNASAHDGDDEHHALDALVVDLDAACLGAGPGEPRDRRVLGHRRTQLHTVLDVSDPAAPQVVTDGMPPGGIPYGVTKIPGTTHFLMTVAHDQTRCLPTGPPRTLPRAVRLQDHELGQRLHQKWLD
jgi:hypothetical protein